MINKNDHIDKLTPEVIEQYYNGELSNRQMNEVEKLMLNNDFDFEAMEGFENINTDDIQKDLHALNERLDEKTKKSGDRGVLFYLKIAASVLLIAVSFFLIVDYLEPTNNQITQVEDEKVSSNEPEAVEEKEKIPILDDEDSISERIDIEESDSEKTEETTDFMAENHQEEDIVKEEAPQENTTIETESLERITLAEVQQNDEFLEDTQVSQPIKEDHAFEGRAAGVHAAEESLARDNVSRYRAKKLAASPAATSNSTAQKPQLQGKVISAEDGKPLPGVNVVVEGTSTATITDVEGNYNLSVPEGTDSTLVFSFVGLVSNQVDASGKSILNIEMESDVQELSEVVVVGYGASDYEDDTDTYEKAKPSIDISAYQEYLERSVQYPEGETDKGRVVVKFQVNADGSLSDFEVKRSMGQVFDNEALRLIKEGPEWIPAKSNGSPIKDYVRVKIRFEP